MKLLHKYIFVLLASATVFGLYGYVKSAPPANLFREISPETNNQWDVGTSTAVWRGVFSNSMGIGTTTPGEPFAVNGDIFFDSKLIRFASTSAPLLTLKYNTAATSVIPQLVNAWNISTSTAVGQNPIFSIDGLNGRVGIGTSNPASALEVIDTDFPVAQFIRRTTSGGGLRAISRYAFQPTDAIQSTDGATVLFGLEDSAGNATDYAQISALSLDPTNGSEDGGFRFDTLRAGTMTEAMRITELGYVGIGTTTPAQLLSVAGDGYLVGGLGVGAATTTDGNLEVSGKATFGRGILVNSDDFLVNNAGSVGIGTTTPGSLFSINNRAALTDEKVPLFTVASSTLTSTSTFFTILNNGNVGIGTANPSEKLYVLNGGTASSTLLSQFVFQNDASTTDTSLLALIAGTAGNSQIFFGDTDHEFPGRIIYEHSSGAENRMRFFTNEAERLDIDSSGNIGIGTTSPGSFTSIVNSGSLNSFWVSDEATDASPFVINESGNVGIGTTTPRSRLTVAGISTSVDPRFVEFVNTHSAGDTLAVSKYDGGDTGTGLTLRSARTSSSAYNFLKAVSDYDGTPVTQFTLRGDGIVGIGTTSPTQLLSVAGDSFMVGGLGVGNATTTDGIIETSGLAYIGGVLKVASTATSTIGDSMEIKDRLLVGKLQATSTVFMTGLTGATAGTNNDVCVSAAGLIINETTGTCVVSSRRFKHDIIDATFPALEMIMKMRSVTYSPNEDDVSDYENTAYGFIAEEVAEVDPHLVKYGTDGLPRTLDDRGILSVIIKSIQELFEKFLGHDERIEELERQNADLLKRIELLETK